MGSGRHRAWQRARPAVSRFLLHCAPVPRSTSHRRAEWWRVPGRPDGGCAGRDGAHRILPDCPSVERLDEIPFDADRMRLSTVHAMPAGPTLYCKGALESVLPLCQRILLPGGVHALDATVREQVLAAQERMAEQGLRVLAFAYRPAGDRWEREQLEGLPGAPRARGRASSARGGMGSAWIPRV